MANWDKLKNRWNVEDRRGWWVAKTAWWLTVTGLMLVLAVGYFGGQDQALQVLDTMQQTEITQNQSVDTSEFAWEDSYEVFSSTVLGSNNKLWERVFSGNNLSYNKPRLVLFREATVSWCGTATSAIWPHYCPADSTIYLDETFFDELTKKFWAQWWDVAEAYVIAHEVAHHVQNLLWISSEVQRIRKNQPDLANAASVKLELQADCLAWMWANSIDWEGVFEVDEINEAIDAAEAVWDDRIQEAAYWETHPETWTHGSSVDRKKWFSIGYENGDFAMCDTFK